MATHRLAFDIFNGFLGELRRDRALLLPPFEIEQKAQVG